MHIDKGQRDRQGNGPGSDNIGKVADFRFQGMNEDGLSLLGN